MKRVATFSIFRVDNTDAAWAAARRFAQPPAWKVIADAILRATADVSTPEYRSLRDDLDELRARERVEWLEDVDEILQASDERPLDSFAWILGVRLDDDERAFAVDNRRPLPCRRCTVRGSWSSEQDGDYVVRDELLDGPAMVGDDVLPPVAGGFDFVNLPGGLAVSTRVVDWLRAWGVTGWATRPLIAASTGAPSQRASQLVATTFVPSACPEHSGKSFVVCSGCGATLEGYLGRSWSVRSSDVAGLALWSRAADRCDSLYLQRSIVDRLRAQGSHGLLDDHRVTVCTHDP